MSLARIDQFSPSQKPFLLQPTKSHFHFNHSTNLIKLPSKSPLKTKTQKISCSSEELEQPITDDMLALELNLQINKLKTRTVQRQEAFKKSKEILFSEVYRFMGMKPDDLQRKWKKMDEDEKWVLVKGFVEEWSAHFHPLSARSVKEMVDEYIVEADGSVSSSSVMDFFPDFRRLMGFSQNGDE